MNSVSLQGFLTGIQSNNLHLKLDPLKRGQQKTEKITSWFLLSTSLLQSAGGHCKWPKCVCLRRRGGGGAGCGKENVQVTATNVSAFVETLARRGPKKGRADFSHPSMWESEVKECVF